MMVISIACSLETWRTMAGMVAKPQAARGFPSTLAGNDLIMSTRHRAHDDRLHDADRFDRGCEFAERGSIQHQGARLVRIVFQLLERELVHFVDVRLGRGSSRHGCMRHVSWRQ